MQNKTDYQKYIFKSRYARYLEKEDRREEWEETVQRYIDFFAERAKGLSLEEVKEAILNYEVMPSMRSLMTAGKALERDNVCGYNCFAGDTKFVTKNGLKTFAECVGQTVEVLAGDGEWRTATIQQFGQQKVQMVEFRPGLRSKTQLRYRVRVTPNHRWITNRGEVTDLQLGDRIPFLAAPQGDFNLEDFIRGFGYGDGTLDTRGRARIRLCGDKAKYMPYFEQAGATVTYSPSCNGDPLACFSKGRFIDWKQLPENPSHSWFAGWFAADGHANPIQPGVSTQDAEAAKLLVEHAPYAGMAVVGWNAMNNTTNYGPRSAPLNRLTVRDHTEFVVTAIQPDDELIPVYCAVEPVTQSFTLAGGLLTGKQ